MRLACFILPLLAAMPAAAQTAAVRDVNDRLFCNADGVDLRETGDGSSFTASLSLEFLGDVTGAIYPTGATPLFARHDSLRPYISVSYQFPIDAAGKLLGRPRPVRIGAGTGRFAGPRLEPLESLALQIRGGAVTSPAIEINSAIYNIAVVSGEIAPLGSRSPYDTEMTPADFGRLVMAIEGGTRFIILSQHGKEAARIPVPQRSIVAERDKAFAWIQRTAPLLAQGKC